MVLTITVTYPLLKISINIVFIKVICISAGEDKQRYPRISVRIRASRTNEWSRAIHGKR